MLYPDAHFHGSRQWWEGGRHEPLPQPSSEKGRNDETVLPRFHLSATSTTILRDSTSRTARIDQAEEEEEVWLKALWWGAQGG